MEPSKEKRSMTARLLLLAATPLVALAVACGGDDSPAPAATSPAATQPPAATAAPGQTAPAAQTPAAQPQATTPPSAPGGSGALGRAAAEEAAHRYFLTFLGLLSGSADPEDLLNIFAPECREGVDPEDIALAMTFITAFFPQLAQNPIEDVDLGRLHVEETSDGFLVVPEDFRSVRVRVGGIWVNAEEYFQVLGFDDDDDMDEDEVPLLLVERNGNLYVGDCEDLQGFSFN